jgi:hypothetical protein
MKKTLLIIGVIVLAVACGTWAYRVYFPNLIAESIISSEEPPAFVPEKVKTKIKKIKKPVNDGAATIINTMHQSGITLEQVLQAIDEADENQAYAMLDELNSTPVKNPDQFFDIAKKHFPVAFDVEAFRKPFRQKVNIGLIRKGIAYANIYRKKEEVDAETVKSIAKKILLQKEEEFNKMMHVN